MEYAVILLDVDGTLVDGQDHYNHGLLQALQQAQKAHPELRIVLFTAYEWGEVLVQRAQRGLTRLTVRQTLAAHGITVEAVIISGSNQAETTPEAFGSYYQHVFAPIEEQLVAATTKDHHMLHTLLARYPDLALQDSVYRQRNQALRTLDTQAYGGNNNKESMFRHVLDYFDPRAQFLVLDDNAAVLAAAKALQEQEGYPLQGHLTTVQGYQAGLETQRQYLQLLEYVFAWSASSPAELLKTSFVNKSKQFLQHFLGRRSSQAAPSASLPIATPPPAPRR